VRFAYAITTAILLGGAAAAVTLQPPAGAQTAQNAPEAIAALAPRAGAPLSFADLVARLQPAVVNISTKQTIKVQPQANPFAGTPFSDLFGGQDQGGGAPVTRQGQSLGSGFLISPDGYVVTNNHVVAAGARGATVDSITVILTDRKEYTAKLIGKDPASDLALLKIDAKNLPFVRFGDSTRSRVGDWVIAIGNPFGLGSTVTAGIISALHRATGLNGGAYDRFIQTDASINQGNSGGPMFDLSGNVIGVNSQILSPSGGNVGIGFAIPAEQVKPIIDTLMKGAPIKRGYLGVGIQPITEDIASALGLPKNVGEIISTVSPGQPAAKAGVKPGDVVVKVNGQDVSPDQTLSYLVANVAPGSNVRLDIIRDGKPVSVAAVAGTRPSEDEIAATLGQDNDGGVPDEDGDQVQTGAANALGLSVTPLTPQIARTLGFAADASGVVVVSVDPASDAAQKGLRRGDLIVSINRAPVTMVADVARAIAGIKSAGRDTALVFVQRARGGGGFTGIKLKK
jgi:serine protease Do